MMRTARSVRLLRLLLPVIVAAPLAAQDDPPAEQPADGDAPRELKLDGIWGVEIGGRYTGVDVEVRHLGNVFRATYAKLPARNPLGIRPGFDFCRGTLRGNLARGTIEIRRPAKDGNGPPERESAPMMLRVSEDHNRITLRIQKEGMKEAEREIELVKPGAISNLRLYAAAPGGAQPTAEVLEDVPMLVDVQVDSGALRPVEVTVTADEQELTLTANSWTRDDGSVADSLRTEPFLPTFGQQLGVVRDAPSEEETPPGREATRDDFKEIVGVWKAVYRDAVLGNITGWVHVGEFGGVTLNYEDPETKFLNEMKLTSARVDGEVAAQPATDDGEALPALSKLQLVFEGEGVRSDKIERPGGDDYPRLLLPPEGPHDVTLSAKQVTAEVPLRYRDNPDTNQVTLTLESREETNLLVWKWRYLADRATNRDGAGYGRVGVMLRRDREEESTVGEMTGREAWLRHEPVIVSAFALEEQLERNAKRTYGGEPVAEHRYAERKDPSEPYPLERTGDFHRTVFVVARNLPPADAAPVRVAIGEGSGVEEYRIRARGEEHAGDSDDLKKGWERYKRIRESMGAGETESRIVLEGAEEPPPAREEGFVMLAVIEPGADPGPQPFTLSQADGAWDLLYGDTVGTLSIARQISPSGPQESGEWEPVSVAFSPERLHLVVQVKTRVESIDTIYAALSVKGELQEFEGDKKIPLKADPNDPTVYLSPPIEIVREADYERFKDQPGAIVIPHKVGTKLLATAARDSGYAIGPSPVEAKVLANPARLNRHWKDAVKRAADLAGQPIEDWNTVLRGEAGNATNFIITDFVFNNSIAPAGLFLSNMQEVASYVSGSNIEIPLVRWWRSQSQSNAAIRSLKISVGDHAAMLLLRDEFVKMMQEQVRDWNANQGRDAMQRIFAAQKGVISQKRSPLSFIRVPIKSLPGYTEGAQSRWDRVRLFFGEEENPYLFQLFDNEVLYNSLRIEENDETFRRLQWEAFRHAYRQWGPKMRVSIGEALNTADSDVLGLMKLTGNGFEPVVQRLLPMLLKLEDEAGQNRNRWVPDRVARAYVKSLGVLGAAVRAQEELSEIDTTVAVTAAALITIPLGNVGGIWSAMAALAFSVADLGYAIYSDVYRNSLNEDQLEFEIGAGAVLGANRVAETEAKILSGWQQALSIGGSLIGVGADAGTVTRALRAARAMKAGEVVDAATEIMRRVDVADPAALRQLSKADQAILARYIEDAETLARNGRAGELTEQAAEALANRNAVRAALEDTGSMAERARLLDEAAEAPSLTLTRAELDDAATRLDDAIAVRNREIDELRARQPANADEAAEIRNRVTGIKDEVGDLQQRRQVVETFREPKVRVPEDVARAMNGEIEALTDAHRTGLRQTRSRVLGNAASRADDLTEVNLTAARKRLDDLSTQAQSRIDELRRAGNAGPAELGAAERRLSELEEVGENVRAMESHAADNTRVRLPEADAELLRAERMELSALDRAQVEDAIVRSAHDWGDLSKRAAGTGQDQLLMHKVARYRRELVNKLADEAMAEVEALTGKKLTRDAFGSTNLSSDYDAAIKGPGAELAIRRFNEKIRKVFGGRESGTVVDTNLYTDPVYNVYKASGLIGPEGKVTRAQLDTARQFLFQQMANAKYRTPAQWRKFRENLLRGTPPEAREAVGDLLDQARGANDLASGRIEKRLAELAGGDEVTENMKLAVTNELYADTLEQIHNYRRFAEHLDDVRAGRAAAGEAPIPPALRDSELAGSLAKIDEMLASRNPLTRSAGREALENLQSRAVLNMRAKQGEALYYAAEAYQTRGTISHVVGELQAGGKKVIADDVLKGRRRPTDLGRDDYVNSYYENGANLIKELNGKHVLDEAGNVVAVPGKMEKAATKGAKYFIRQIDAANMAGVDFAKAGVPDVNDLVRATVELDKVRGDMAKFKDVLKKYGWSGEDYLRRVVEANDALDAQVLRGGSLPGFASDLHSAERAAEHAAAFPNGTRPANGLVNIPKPLQAGERATRLRDEFAESDGERLAALNLAARSGRALTDEQRAERERLTQVANAQNGLDRAVAAARLSGLTAGEIDRVLAAEPSADDPAALRNRSASNLLEAVRAKPPARTSWRDVNGNAPAGALPDETRQALGLDTTRSANPAALANALRSSGRHVTRPETPLAPDVLASHLAGGRQVLALIDSGAGDGPAWVRVHEFTDDTVRADDPVTGQPFDYPPDLFDRLSANRSEVVIIDPFRDAEGNLRRPVGDERSVSLPELDAVFPLPGE